MCKEGDEVVKITGVEELQPKYCENGAKEIIYFCAFCEEPPVHVDPGMVVIPIFHDTCKVENAKLIFAEMRGFIRAQEMAIDSERNQNANDRLERNPNAEI